MPKQTDEIFVLKKGVIRSVSMHSMRSGIFGKTLEDALQTLLQDYPEIIPGTQIDPASDEPPRFVLLRREMPVAGWSLDHLYVDQYGVLTLVETKLLQNPESRRDVIGQIIEYAANAQEVWAFGKARQYAVEYWSKRGKDFNDILSDKFPELDIEEFWKKVEDNLSHRRIRLIIASDTIRPEVRRMVEYLNSEMQNTEVLGLELKIYGENDDELVFVPRIIGQTQALADWRSEALVRVWDVNQLTESFSKLANDKGRAFLRLLDWAIETGCFIESKAQSPTFGLAGLTGDRLFSVSNTGHIYVFFEESRYPGGLSQRKNLLDALVSLDFMSQDIVLEEVVSGRNSSRKLWDLDESELEELLHVLAQYCR